MAGNWVQLTGNTIEALETVSAVNMDHVAEVRFTGQGFVVLTYSHGATRLLLPEDAQVIREWLTETEIKQSLL
jgi:hypothetical protein